MFSSMMCITSSLREEEFYFTPSQRVLVGCKLADKIMSSLQDWEPAGTAELIACPLVELKAGGSNPHNKKHFFQTMNVNLDKRYYLTCFK
jgi:hypothetical protein